MSTPTQPTPITDQMEASLARATNVTRYYAALAQMRMIEVERDEARERERIAVASWDEERLRGQREAERVIALQQQLEAMREAIREAHEALMLAPYRDQEALAKLQPFLKP